MSRHHLSISIALLVAITTCANQSACPPAETRNQRRARKRAEKRDDAYKLAL